MSFSKQSFWIILTLFYLVVCGAQNWKSHKEFQPKRSRKFADSLNCTTKFTNDILQLIIDYAQWRNVAMLYLVDESINSGCNMKAIRRNLDCFISNDISISLQRKFRKHVYTYHKAKRVLVVSFLKATNMNYDNYLEQVNLISRTDGYYLWLNIHQGYNSSSSMEKHALEVLSSSEINLGVDMVIAVEMPKPESMESPEILLCKRQNQVSSISLGKKDVATFLPFNQSKSGNNSEHGYFGKYCEISSSYSDISYCVLQVYKIRKSENSSMVIRPLGQWQYESGTQALKPFQSIESRDDFQGYPIIFGKKQFTQEASIAEEHLIEDDNDVENMDKILDFIADDLNARVVVKMYPTLGLKSATGNWSGLLGAVVQQEVDVALDSVIKIPERYSDMSFTQDIMVSIRDIYLKPEESHTARDIYLQPFKPKLLLCVLATGLIFATVMSIYITLIRKIEIKKYETGSGYSAISDAILWSFSVISMQGSTVQPKSYSGKIIVVISLMFALLIYNSYSAFITSILSFKITEIRSVDDLLASDYDIGYTKNSQDEVFLRSMNNESQLNQIYLRGYLHNNINNVTDGLLKVIKGNYGFFVTRHIARKQILKISGYKCRYDIMELTIKSTRNKVAFPISRNSPYRKLINMCLIKLTESGLHDYITSLIEPSLPVCDKPQTYQSARINDLTTSFILLGIGVTLGTVVVVLETFWKRRRVIYAKLKARSKRFNNYNSNGLNSNTRNMDKINFNPNAYNLNRFNQNAFNFNNFNRNTNTQWIQ